MFGLKTAESANPSLLINWNDITTAAAGTLGTKFLEDRGWEHSFKQGLIHGVNSIASKYEAARMPLGTGIDQYAYAFGNYFLYDAVTSKDASAKESFKSAGYVWAGDILANVVKM